MEHIKKKKKGGIPEISGNLVISYNIRTYITNVEFTIQCYALFTFSRENIGKL